MRILTLAYLALICLSAVLVSTCSAPTTPPLPAPDMQRQLGRALDSVDRAACGAPVGCSCQGLDVFCPDLKPERP